jgi:LysM repeat protein
MPESEPKAADVIDMYRRRRTRMVPLVLGGMAVVLLVVGLFLVIIWLTGDNPPSLPFLASRTPTPTQTSTPLPPSLTPTITNTLPPSDTPTPEGPKTYTVEVGDTLYSIAERFGVTMDLLIASNTLADPNNLGVGSQLIIPAVGAELPTETPIPTGLPRGSKVNYTVKTGDSLQSIAAKYNSTAERIATENKMKLTDVLYVGRVLVVVVNIVTPTTTPTGNPATATGTMVP